MRQRRRAGTGVLVVALAAALAGWLIPRGPVTTPEAVGALIAALAVGCGSAMVVRSRWIILVAPVSFMLVFELVRMRTDGPTVDGIALGGLYGVIALLGGRGIDALLMLLPLMVGCSWGLVLARCPGPVHRGGLVAWVRPASAGVHRTDQRG